MTHSQTVQLDTHTTIRDRYLRDPLPVRLGGLAANLARAKSFSTHSGNREAVLSLLEESARFLSWTNAELDVSLQTELAELQQLLMQWQVNWQIIWDTPEQRTGLATQAGHWSQLVLERSGLLNR